MRHPNAADELLSDALADPAEEVASAAREIQAARAAARRAEATRAAETARAGPSGSAGGTRSRGSASAPYPVAVSISFARPSAPASPAPDQGLLGKLKRLFR